MPAQSLVDRQREYFFSRETLPYEFRKGVLNTIRETIYKYEDRLKEALYKDLHKNETESYFSEIGQVLKEISYLEKNLKKLMKKKRKKSPLVDFPSSSFIAPIPYGVVAIISPWNYPFLLTMGPLVGALAAGNTAIIKPSEFSIHTTALLQEMIAEIFDPKYVTVLDGGVQTTQNLLDQKLDYIFFTGSTKVGKIVMEKAAKHLTPISLELGGKSPVIICKDSNIKIAAKRIAFGKYLNAGQTCIAPDYVYVHSSLQKEFIEHFKDAVTEFFGDNPLASSDYGKIISDKHFMRLQNLMKEGTVLTGGDTDETQHKIAPTLLNGLTTKSKIMQEEIFGPLLPLLTYDNLDEVISYINHNPTPLALYLFTENKRVEDKVLNECHFGGGCINDTVVHFSSDYLPFGGVGESGMGSYHREASFHTFTHYRSILKKSTLLDLKVRYAPYNKTKENITKKLLK